MKLVPFFDADWDRFVAFAAGNIGNSPPVDRRFFEHFFRSDESGIWSGRILESDDGDFEGVAFLIEVPAKFGDAPAQIAWPSVLFASPKAQAVGGGAQLAFWYYRNLPFVPSIGGTVKGNMIKDRLSLRTEGIDLERFILVLSPRAAELAPPECRQAVTDGVYAGGGSAAPGLRATWSDGIPADYEHVWRNFRRKFMFTTERSPAYLRWRYVDAPLLSYKFLAVHDDRGLVGLAVTRVQKTPAGPVCRIVDFVCEPDRAVEAWRAVVGELAEEDFLFADFFVVGTAFHTALAEASFHRCDGKVGIGGLPNLLSPPEHRDWNYTFHVGGTVAMRDHSWRRPDAVYFTKGDSDRDWPTMHDIASMKNG